MDPNASSYRFLGFPSASPSPDVTANGNDELSEDDIFWTNDFPEQPEPQRNSLNSETGYIADDPSNIDHNRMNRRGTSFLKNAGILAALPEASRHTIVYRKPASVSSSSSSAAKSIPLIPRPPHGSEHGEAVLSSSFGRKMNQSAPVDVPLLSIAMAKKRNMKFKEMEDGDDGEEEMLPPHEIVARGDSRRDPKTTFSMLEGVGRTLKGRDLRQVRNAVWRQTGFLD